MARVFYQCIHHWKLIQSFIFAQTGYFYNSLNRKVLGVLTLSSSHFHLTYPPYDDLDYFFWKYHPTATVHVLRRPINQRGRNPSITSARGQATQDATSWGHKKGFCHIYILSCLDHPSPFLAIPVTYGEIGNCKNCFAIPLEVLWTGVPQYNCFYTYVWHFSDRKSVV